MSSSIRAVVGLTAVAYLCSSCAICAKWWFPDNGPARVVREAPAFREPSYTETDWRYTQQDFKGQIGRLSTLLLNRWIVLTGYQDKTRRPRIVVTEVDNETDTFLSAALVRESLESLAMKDGRFDVIVGDPFDSQQAIRLLEHVKNDHEYSNSYRQKDGETRPPQVHVRIKLKKSTIQHGQRNIDEYYMSMRLYDLQNDVKIDSAWDKVWKRITPMN